MELSGPIKWPIFGSLFSLIGYKERTLMEWTKFYGPIYQLKLGSLNAVVFNGYEAVKTVLLTKDDVLSDRQRDYLFQTYREGQGIFFCPDNSTHLKLKSTLLKNIKVLKKQWEVHIRKENIKLLKYLSANISDPIDLQDPLAMTVANILLKTLFTKSFSFGSNRLKHIMSLCCIGKTERDKKVALMATLNWLKFVPGINGIISQKRSEHFQIKDALNKHFEERKRIYDDDKDQINDLASALLHDHPDLTKDDLNSFFCMSEDMMTGGTQTTKIQTLWIVLELLKHPHHIKRVQDEIDSVFDDANEDDYYTEVLQSKLHFTRSVIEEGMRLRPLAPTSVFHVPLKDTEIQGYKIPKDVVLIPNIWSVHREAEFWGPDPDSYRPERHLDLNGEFVSSGHVIPFGLGRRKCAGSKMVYGVIMAFMVTIFKNFEIELCPSDDVYSEGVSVLVYHPPTFKVQLKERS